MKKWLFIIIVLVIAGGVLGFWWWQSKSNPTTNWQTYRNEEYGFEFKYPQNWSITSDDGEYAYQGELESFGIGIPSSVKNYTFGLVVTDKETILRRENACAQEENPECFSFTQLPCSDAQNFCMAYRVASLFYYWSKIAEYRKPSSDLIVSLRIYFPQIRPGSYYSEVNRIGDTEFADIIDTEFLSIISKNEGANEAELDEISEGLQIFNQILSTFKFIK